MQPFKSTLFLGETGLLSFVVDRRLTIVKSTTCVYECSKDLFPKVIAYFMKLFSVHLALYHLKALNQR